MKTTRFVFSIFISIVILSIVQSKYVAQSDFSTSDDFSFLTNFCFDTTGDGSLAFQHSFPKDSDIKDIFFCAYTDIPNTNKTKNWSQIYNNNGLSCQEKLDQCSPSQLTINGSFFVEFHDVTRPHFWYFALLNCKNKDVRMSYTFDMTQFTDGIHHQFSYDEQGLLEIYIVFMIFFLIAVSINIYGDFQMWMRKSFHPILRVLTISLIMQFASIIFYVIHYSAYVSNGVGVPAVRGIGLFFDMFSTLIFMFLLILISTGWGILYPSVSHVQQKKIVLLVILGIFVALYITLFFWEIFGINPAVNQFLYSTIPGIIFLCVRFLVMVYFIFCLQRSIRDSDSDKRKFYIIFGIGYLLWFLALGLIAIIALNMMAWNRERWTRSIYLISTALGYFVLVGLLYPRFAAKYFQIAVPDLLIGTEYQRL